MRELVIERIIKLAEENEIYYTYNELQKMSNRDLLDILLEELLDGANIE